MIEGYGAGPSMIIQLEVFWDQQEEFTLQNGYHGLHLKETQGTTEGGLILPILFNFIVDNMVRNWLEMIV